MKIYILFLLLYIAGQSGIAQNLDSGLIADWPFNGNANDVSGYGHHGTVYGATLTTDRYNNPNSAYYFTTDGWQPGTLLNQIFVPYSSSFNITNITVTAWIKPLTYGFDGHAIIINRYQFGYSNPNGETWRFGYGGTNQASLFTELLTQSNFRFTTGLISPQIPLNSWSFVCFTFDGIHLKSYINGVTVKDTIAPNGFLLNIAGNSGLSIGVSNQANGYWGAYKGTIDDIKLYNRALSQNEISILYSAVPLAPLLVSPANNSINVSLTPTVVWNTVSGATGYKVKISTDSAFTSVTDSATVTTNQYQIPGGKLSYNTKYFWKVAGYNAYGVGQYSSVWNFTTLNPLPQTVTLLSPANGSSNVTLTPTLFWNTSTGSTSYRVQVSPNSGFSYIVDSATVTTNQRTIPAGKLNIATTYYWRVHGINSFGNGPWSEVWNFFTVITGVQQLGYKIPKEYKLYNNYPNPFNPVTIINFDIPEQSLVKVIIFDILGKEVETVINDKLSPGKYQIQWNGSNNASGIYFYRIITNSFSDIKRMVLIK